MEKIYFLEKRPVHVYMSDQRDIQRKWESPGRVEVENGWLPRHPGQTAPRAMLARTEEPSIPWPPCPKMTTPWHHPYFYLFIHFIPGGVVLLFLFASF